MSLVMLLLVLTSFQSHVTSNVIHTHSQSRRSAQKRQSDQLFTTPTLDGQWDSNYNLEVDPLKRNSKENTFESKGTITSPGISSFLILRNIDPRIGGGFDHSDYSNLLSSQASDGHISRLADLSFSNRPSLKKKFMQNRMSHIGDSPITWRDFEYGYQDASEEPMQTKDAKDIGIFKNAMHRHPSNSESHPLLPDGHDFGESLQEIDRLFDSLNPNSRRSDDENSDNHFLDNTNLYHMRLDKLLSKKPLHPKLHASHRDSSGSVDEDVEQNPSVEYESKDKIQQAIRSEEDGNLSKDFDSQTLDKRMYAPSLGDLERREHIRRVKLASRLQNSDLPNVYLIGGAMGR